MKKRKKFALMLWTILLFVIPSYSFALTIFETTGWIIGTDDDTFNFLANQAPYTYEATLVDLSTPPNFGFENIFMSISTATDLLASISDFGSTKFNAVPGETHYAYVSGTGGGNLEAGLFGLQVSTTPVPEPATMVLICSGLICLVGLSRKIRK